MVKRFAEKTRSSAPGQSQKNREAGMQTGAKTRLWSYSSQGRDGGVLLCLACMTTGLFKEHGIIVASRERLMPSPLIASHCSLQGRLTSSIGKEYAWYRSGESLDSAPV